MRFPPKHLSPHRQTGHAHRNRKDGGRAEIQGSPSPIEGRVADLLARTTLAEEIGQMTKVERSSIGEADITIRFVCS